MDGLRDRDERVKIQITGTLKLIPPQTASGIPKDYKAGLLDGQPLGWENINGEAKLPLPDSLTFTDVIENLVSGMIGGIYLLNTFAKYIKYWGGCQKCIQTDTGQCCSRSSSLYSEVSGR